MGLKLRHHSSRSYHAAFALLENTIEDYPNERPMGRSFFLEKFFIYGNVISMKPQRSQRGVQDKT